MSRMSDFSIWVEDMLVSCGYDPDDFKVMDKVSSKQDKLLNLYMDSRGPCEPLSEFASILSNRSG